MKAILSCALLISAALPTHGEQSGLFTYVVTGGEVTITDYPEDASGHVEIPAEIDGLPVKAIGEYAFAGCSALTSISIPTSVTRIDLHGGHSGWAFSGCNSLRSIEVAPGNPSYASVDGALYDAGVSMLLRLPPGRAAEYRVPDGVTHVRRFGFEACDRLTHLTLPASVADIGPYSFKGCTSLEAVEVTPGSPAYSSRDGVLFNAEGTWLYLFPQNKAGEYRIPDGVTTIVELPDPSWWIDGRYNAFIGCKRLTSVTLPPSVTRLGVDPFLGCPNLTSISVDPGNPALASSNGVLFDADQDVLVRFPEGKGGTYAVPSGTREIAAYAFSGCAQLQSVILPQTITRIGGLAFSNCSELSSAIFLGDAPEMGTVGSIFGSGSFTQQFVGTHAGFTVYFLMCRKGFGLPVWRYPGGFETTGFAYRTVALDESGCPAATWLVSHGLSQDTDLNQDLNGDGVSLLMAYALELDPGQDLRPSMPVPVMAGNSLRLSYAAPRPELSYAVETSADLEHWTTEGVVLSTLDEGNLRIATVPLDAPRRFLRLRVSATTPP